MFWPLILFNWAHGSHINIIYLSPSLDDLLSNEIMFKALENVKELKYLVMKVTNGSFICEGIKGTLNSGSAYEHLVSL